VPLTERLDQQESANASLENGPSEVISSEGEGGGGSSDDDDDDIGADGLVDMGHTAMRTFQECLDDNIYLIKDFLNGLEYQ
jgi:hypothetical protein